MPVCPITRFSASVDNLYLFTGRVFVYGGIDVNIINLASVEMLSTTGNAWHILPTPMYKADWLFSSVPLP